MLEHFHAGHAVELAGLFARQIFGGDQAVIHFLPAFQQMQLRDLERFFGEVDTGYISTAHRHAFRQNAAAATDIEHAFALDADQFVDVIQAQRVDLVQGFEFAVRIPPACGQRTELGEFGRIDVWVGLRSHISVRGCAAARWRLWP